jgi:hypothetical protein
MIRCYASIAFYLLGRDDDEDGGCLGILILPLAEGMIVVVVVLEIVNTSD